MADIYHNKNADVATIAAEEDTSGEVHVGDYCRGSFSTDADLVGDAITFEVSNDKTQWDGLRDAAGAAVTAVVVTTEKNYRLPEGVFSYRWLRFKNDAAQGVGTPSDITVFLASMAAS
jgi:hypothetical protein